MEAPGIEILNYFLMATILVISALYLLTIRRYRKKIKELEKHNDTLLDVAIFNNPFIPLLRNVVMGIKNAKK